MPMQAYLTRGNTRVSTSTPTPPKTRGALLAEAGRVCCYIDRGMLFTMAWGLYLYPRLNTTLNRI
jgi:hypothetical protein